MPTTKAHAQALSNGSISTAGQDTAPPRTETCVCVCGARVTFEITYPVVVTLLILVLWLCTGVEDLGLVEFGIGVG